MRHSTLRRVTGLIACAERLGDAESLQAAERAGQWLLRTYAPVDRADHRFFKSASGGGCNVDVCDQSLRLPGDYCRIHRRWSSGDHVEMTLSIPVGVRPLGDCGVAVVRGPEVLAVGSRDNPKVDLDKITIPAEVRLATAPSEGSRRRYIGQVRNEARPAEIVFTPYADAGNGSRFRTMFPQSP